MHRMECDRILELLPGRLDGTLEEQRVTEVETHLRECPRCAAEEEAQKETLALLKNLPPEKAPPELLEGIRRKIAAGTGKTGAGKGLLASARIRIPLEAAAAVLLFLLVYGIQKQIPGTERPAAPPARMEAASSSERTDRQPPVTARKPAGETSPRERAAVDTGRAESDGSLQQQVGPRESAPRGEDRIEAAADRTAPAGPGKKAPSAANASLPAVPAVRVSTGAESVVPRAREEERAEAPPPFRVFAEPPSRLLRPLPYGRELILEVDAGKRAGLEERIVRVVERFGGSILREWHFRGAPSGEADGAPILEGPMRIRIPSGSSEAFLSELRKLGTIPPEEMPASVDLPAGPAPDVVGYTLRVRVR